MKTKYRADFHIHTKASFDGYNSYSNIYKNAQKHSLDIIAITDHDTIKGAQEFLKWLKKHKKDDLDVILGEEVTCLDGTHIIGLFLKEHIPSDTPLNVIQEIKRQKGLVYFPHPARKDGILNSKEVIQAVKLGDLFEVFNGKVHQSFNNIAQNSFAKFQHMIPLGGSDAHYNADIQKCICTIELENKSTLLDALKIKKIKSILIEGHKNETTTLYFGSYYKIKDILNLPQFVRDLGKRVYPFIRNYRNRNKIYKTEKVYYYEF